MKRDLNGPQGETGATGTGVGSITKQFYLSTSKTTQAGGSWVETMPTWVNGKYLWTRDKIVYTNPASTKYTTPIVSSEWEAVNEIEIGARNLYIIRNSHEGYLTVGGAYNTYGNMGASYQEHTSQDIIVTAGETIQFQGWVTKTWDPTSTTDYFWHAYQFYAADKSLIGSRWTNTSSTTVNGKEYFKHSITVPTNAAILRVSARLYTDGKIKVEKGNIATDWTLAPEDGAQGNSFIYVEGTQTAAGAAWKGKTNELTELTAGTQILYKLPYAGAANVTLDLTLANGTTTGAKNCYYKYSGTRLSTQYPANSTISMLYDGTQWIVTNPYTNDNTYDRTRYNNVIKAAAAITADRLIVGTSAGYVTAAAGISFDINYPVLWCQTAFTGAGNTQSNNYITIPSKNLRNNKSGITLTQYKMAYLKGTLSGNIFTIDTAVFSNEPTTEDGKYYIPIGILYSTYQVYFDCGMPTVYKYYDGAFRPLPRT